MIRTIQRLFSDPREGTLALIVICCVGLAILRLLGKF